MFHRIQQYPLISAEARVYRPRAYGDPRPDGVWDGWLVFFPIAGGRAIATDRETTQPSVSALTAWAADLSEVYLVGALERALRLAEEPHIVTSLAHAEYDALAAAEELETMADLERLAADIDERAAESARSDVRAIERERLATEQTLAAAEETAASAEAAAHERAAKTARAVAADARQRRRRTTGKQKSAKRRDTLRERPRDILPLSELPRERSTS